MHYLESQALTFSGFQAATAFEMTEVDSHLTENETSVIFLCIIDAVRRWLAG
jgi:hypothetical protein